MPLSSLFAVIARLFQGGGVMQASQLQTQAQQGIEAAGGAAESAKPFLQESNDSSTSTSLAAAGDALAWLDLCEPLTQASEGCVLKAYPDPASGGVPYTCGWGSTGPDVTATTVWSQQEADNRLRVDLVRFGGFVDELVLAPVSPQQKAALVDFAYNVGPGNLASSTLLKKLNATDFAGAADQFPIWNKAAGRVMPGLVTRRARERDLFLTGVWK